VSTNNEAYIFFRKETSKRLKLTITSMTDFKEIFKVFNTIRFSSGKINDEHVIFAVLELINNSLRAQREAQSMKDIYVRFKIENSALHIRIQDWGGGFDISKLPYNLTEDPEDIDTNNQEFQEYREKNNFLRFGMGLYVAKKTFSGIDITFKDLNNKPVLWESGNAAGTCIDLLVGGLNG